MIVKAFLICPGNVFEKLFTWREPTDSMSEGIKILTTEEGEGGGSFTLQSLFREHVEPKIIEEG